jgi:hypothetical protein
MKEHENMSVAITARQTNPRYIYSRRERVRQGPICTFNRIGKLLYERRRSSDDMSRNEVYCLQNGCEINPFLAPKVKSVNLE